MKLSIVHSTTYTYGDAVTTSHHEARLAPRDGENQRALSHEVMILPDPKARRRSFDYFGNRTLHFSLSEPHRELQIIARSVVDVVPSARALRLEATPAWESVRDQLRVNRRRDTLDAYEMCMESPHVALVPALGQYAAPSFAPGVPLLLAVQDLVSRIHAEFTYDPRATEISTPLSEVLEHRRGVCQDFAHLAIGCLRSQGVAARYVSGYLLTRPPVGKPRLVGADASHAWISTFLPDYGWVDFDPTNNVLPRDEHITVAYGRDFADVTPVHGVIRGGGQHQLQVSVDVAPIE